MRKAFLVLGLLVLMAGCSDDATDAPEVETPDPLPGTVNILANDFVEALENMSDEGLAHILHEDFQFNILQSTIDDWDGSDHPFSTNFFDRTSTLATHANIFGGVEGLNEAGQPALSVESIVVSVFNLDGAWELISEEDDFYDSYPGAYIARYNTLLHLYLTNSSRWEIDQNLLLVAVMVPDGDVEGWQLLAARGAVNYFVASATENVSYDSILAMYRF